MAVALRAKIPGLFTQQLSNPAKDDALDHHLAVKVIVDVEPAHALNRDAVQHDSTTLVIYFPAFDDTGYIRSRRRRRDVKVHVREFVGPEAAEVVDRVGDRHKERVDAAAQARKMRPRYGATHAPAVTIAVEAAVGNGTRKGVSLLIPGQALNARAKKIIWKA